VYIINIIDIFYHYGIYLLLDLYLVCIVTASYCMRSLYHLRLRSMPNACAWDAGGSARGKKQLNLAQCETQHLGVLDLAPPVAAYAHLKMTHVSFSNFSE